MEWEVLGKGTSSADDQQVRSDWMERQAAKAKDLTISKQKLAKRQHGRCPQCGEALFNDEELQVHHLHARADGGKNVYRNRVLVHVLCHQHIHAASKRALSDCQEVNNRDLLPTERKAVRRTKSKE